MNVLARWLAEGDLNSDGRANKAREILTEDADFPNGWVKSLAVQAMINNK